MLGIASMEATIGQNGLLVPYRMFREKMGTKYNAFTRGLTITYKPDIGPPKFAHLFEIILVSDGVFAIMLPRVMLSWVSKFICPVREIFPAVRRIEPEFTAELYHSQQVVLAKLREEFARTHTSTILNMRAGTGKTFVAAALIAHLRVRTLYVVINKVLLHQAIGDLDAAITGISIAGYKDNPRADVVVVVINSALKMPRELLNSFDLIIYDEVHMLCSESRRKLFWRVCPRYALGMSATTAQRVDGFDKFAIKMLCSPEPIIARDLAGYVESANQFRGRVRAIDYYGDDEFTQNLTHEKTGKVFTHYMYRQFCDDLKRREVCARALADLYDWRGPEGQKHNIYVFAEELDILRVFVSTYREMRQDMYADSEIAMFVGGMNDSAIEDAIANKRVLLATYGYAGTGVSIVKMTAILFLTPRKSGMLQICGRIFRSGSDLSIAREIVDVVDRKTCLTRQFAVRRAAYEEYNMDIIHEKISV